LLREDPCSFPGDVACCVEIPVEGGPAALTFEHPGAEEELGSHCSTARTGLRRGVEAVDDHQGGSSIVALIDKLAAQLTQTGISHGSPEMVLVARHGGHTEILDGHGVETVD
jgi:hypothetical protein